MQNHLLQRSVERGEPVSLRPSELRVADQLSILLGSPLSGNRRLQPNHFQSREWPAPQQFHWSCWPHVSFSPGLLLFPRKEKTGDALSSSTDPKAFLTSDSFALRARDDCTQSRDSCSQLWSQGCSVTCQLDWTMLLFGKPLELKGATSPNLGLCMCFRIVALWFPGSLTAQHCDRGGKANPEKEPFSC